ncbi:MAG TPA: RNA polymerase sporulation sigma factor SigH [Frankiaceae bacterium]|nr:RNA polymerase sporulation sigma factor SigH [Frankiaceae bacterium]
MTSSDEDLAVAARAGDGAASSELIARYRPFLRARARSFFLLGADMDDVLQEAMIGLFKAIRDFDAGRQTHFRGFADMCIQRQLITAVKGATRHKHGPLNTYVSFSRPIGNEDDGERSLGDVLPAGAMADPVEQVVSGERVRALQSYLDRELSDLEVEVLRMHVDGKSYAEIADSLQRQTKSIDNALQRIKRKLSVHLSRRAAAEAG